MKRLILPALALTCLLVTSANAAIVFGTPDGAFATTNGLNGNLWSNAAIDPVDTLAAAHAYMGANAVDATFMSTTVDYPNGGTVTVLAASTTISAALGVDGGTVSPGGVGSNFVLNSIMQFTGYLVIDAPKTVNFQLNSDDGSELIIQGTQIINNDGIHPFFGGSPGPVAVEFTSAGLYEMEIVFFESQVSGWGIEFRADGSIVSNSMLSKGVTDIPEPTTFIVWSMLASLGLSFCWRRRTRK